MADSRQLVHRWHERLELGERMLTNPSPRLRWMGRVYVRLYRFLLSVYGGGEWQRDTTSLHDADASVGVDDSASQMPLVDLSSHDSGAPAKSLEQIRHTLQSVHSANTRPVEFGPLQSGLKQESWIAVAEVQKPRAGELREALRRAGISSRKRLNGRREIIDVRFCDYEPALVIANKLAAIRTLHSQPARRLKSKTSPFTLAEAGAVIGFLAGPFVCYLLIVLYFVMNEVLTILHIVQNDRFLDLEASWKSGACVAVVWMLCVFLGVWIGHRRRRRHRSEGRDAAN